MFARRMPLFAVAVIVALLGSMVSVAPAHAAAALLTVTKLVNGQPSVTLAPDQEFTYTIQVGCDDTDCLNASLSDQLPAEFAGFPILATSVQPSAQPSTSSYTGCSTTVTANCVFTATFGEDLGAGQIGIVAGDTYTVSITLKAPANLNAEWASNNVAVANTATATADTADPASASANVTVVIPITVDTTVGKTWAPASQQFSPGVASAVTLTTANTSNVAATSLSLQDPTAAAAGAVTLGASNPFTIVDFAGFGAVSAPQGADTVTVDAYVLDGGSNTWNWVTGTPSTIASIALPSGVAAADVGGVRVRFTDSASGATISAGGTAGSVALNVVQRSTNRTTSASLVSGASITNQVLGSVNVPNQATVTETASAPYAIGALSVSVQAGKTITPSRIPAGTSAAATITGKNNSNGPLASLTLSDTNFFTADLAFGGFTSAVNYPAGASGATITWYFSDNSQSTAAVSNGQTPTAPTAPVGEHLTGFAVVYTGAVAAGVTASLNFAISPDATFVAGTNPVALVNTVVATATNPAGSASDSDSANLSVFAPDISLTIDKTISPTGAVTPGGTVVVQLPTTTSTDSAYVKPTSIVVEDVWRDTQNNDFWNAFNPVAIAPTQVPLGATLTIEYTTDGVTWQPFDTVDATASPQVYTANISDVVAPDSVVGLRYTFTQPSGFAQGTTVSPNTNFQARATLRSSPFINTSVADGPASVYENRGFASAAGEVAGGVAVQSAEVGDLANGSIVSYSGGAGSIVAGKQWQNANLTGDLIQLSSQSAAQAGTRLSWGVRESGYSQVTISDPDTNYDSAENTVFQAFDLTQISPITFVQDPLLKWDTVSAVELYYSGAWQTVAAPGGTWMTGAGFKGYTLSATQSANTTGVRLTIQPNDTLRASSTDPLTPPVGSGVATSATNQNRFFGLVWQLRNVVRVPTANTTDWVNQSHGYNTGDPSVISNTVSVGGVLSGVAVTPVEASDTVSLIDQPPGVNVTKTASASTVTIPESTDVDPSLYPTVNFTVTAQNTSSARASYVRVTDPMPCTTAAIAGCVSAPSNWAGDPFTATYSAANNPFERLNLTKIAFTVPASQVDQNASQVTLWKRDSAGVLSTSVVSMTTAAGYTAAQLADVVGASVVYQGTSPGTNGGSIVGGASLVMTLSTQLRVYERSNPTQLVTPFTVDNFAFAQSYDPVLFPSGAQSTPNGTDDATVAFVGGVLDVTASKAFSTSTLLEKNRATPLSVTLGATQGNSTVATNQVTIEDSDQTFWAKFRLTGLGTVTKPAGSDRVRVDVQTNGNAAWILGTSSATATLPSVDLTTVTGIRFTFNRADSGVFSSVSPPANWSAQAVLQVALLDNIRGTSTPVPFPGTVTDQVTTSSERFENPALYAQANSQSSATLTLDTGTFSLDVAKSPLGNIHTVSQGDSVPWTLTFTNTGTGYLTVSSLVDQLSTYLTFDGVDPSYATTSGGTLSTAVTYTYDAPTKSLSFAWPTGGDRMSPGETFTITIGIILEPGLTSSQTATNQFTVTTAQTLGACTNTSGNAQGVLAGLGATQCGTSNYVQPIAGASLVTYKGVKGDIGGSLVSGATNVTNPSAACVADSDGFYRTPCAANTVIGGTDEWKLQATNSGTVNYTSLTFVDPLPFAGDRMLATGGSRGSTYRPVFDGAHGLDIAGAPAGTTTAFQVTTAANVCVGTGPTAWPADPTCSTHPTAANWTDSTAYSGDWADVTGLRIVLTFAGQTLVPGSTVTMHYQTINMPTTASLPGRAPVSVPVTGSYAWNQFGAVATLTSGAPISRAPVKAGVAIASGPLQITKSITGPAAAYAPDQFDVDLACTVDGVSLDLGPDAALELTSAGSYTARVDGIPLGSSCTATEHGSVGSYGESSRSNSPVTIAVDSPAEAQNAVPAAQQATITNDFEFGALSVTKRVDTAATVGAFGPFDFSLSCVSAIGDAVTLPTADQTFSLATDATHTVTADTIPAGASCTLTETSNGGADAVAISGTGVVDAGSGVGTITVAQPGTDAVVTNHFEAGTLSIAKTVDGTGAADFGGGPFTASVHCVYGTPEQVLYDEAALPIIAGQSVLVAPVFPVGTVCSVAEVATGGANSHVDPAAVVITGPASGETVGSVTADVTNHFLVGDLAITKERVGDGVAEFGDGPFTAQVTCTWVKDGQTFTIPLPDAGAVVLSSANGYAGSLTGIIVGASCAVTETDAGFAVSTSMSPANGVVTILDPAVSVTPATVVITNQFDVGQLKIGKTVNSFAATQNSAVGFTITVSNTGQIDANNFTVEDILPAGATVVSAGNGVLNNGVVTWTVPSLAVGDTVDLGIVLKFAAPGQYVNRASVERLFGPWEQPTLADPCGDSSGDVCASILIAALAFTGGSFVYFGTIGALAISAGLALWLISYLRRRRRLA